jgi:hypothetical protein
MVKNPEAISNSDFEEILSMVHRHGPENYPDLRKTKCLRRWDDDVTKSLNKLRMESQYSFWNPFSWYTSLYTHSIRIPTENAPRNDGGNQHSQNSMRQISNKGGNGKGKTYAGKAKANPFPTTKAIVTGAFISAGVGLLVGFVMKSARKIANRQNLATMEKIHNILDYAEKFLTAAG